MYVVSWFSEVTIKLLYLLYKKNMYKKHQQAHVKMVMELLPDMCSNIADHLNRMGFLFDVFSSNWK